MEGGVERHSSCPTAGWRAVQILLRSESFVVTGHRDMFVLVRHGRSFLRASLKNDGDA